MQTPLINDRFFLIYPLNLEDLGEIELKEKFALHFPEVSLIISNRIPGGIEIECPFMVGVSLNKILRTPTRILLRLNEFKCRDFPKLYQKISKFNWAPWLLGQIPEIECAAKNSRLFDSRKIAKAIQEGIGQYYRHKPVKKRYLEHLEKIKTHNIEDLPKLYFRSVEDLCTISIDTTGDRLHLRGEKILTGLAPIRESLAALLLIELKKYLPSSPLSLIDPMCGSGTFLIEATKENALTMNRSFSYIHFPKTIDEKADPLLQSNLVTKKYIKYFGFDNNADVIKQAKSNAPELEFQQMDLFNSDKINSSLENPVVAITNPPYGIRVGENINAEFYQKIITSVKRKFSPEYLGIIIPNDYKLNVMNDYQIVSIRPFSNGGIDVLFYILKL